jgi:hypothetical protein
VGDYLIDAEAVRKVPYSILWCLTVCTLSTGKDREVDEDALVKGGITEGKVRGGDESELILRWGFDAVPGDP